MVSNFGLNNYYSIDGKLLSRLALAGQCVVGSIQCNGMDKDIIYYIDPTIFGSGQENIMKVGSMTIHT